VVRTVEELEEIIEAINMICTNIITNQEAGDKITYWLENGLYQVQKKRGTSIHYIVKLEER